MFQELRVMSNLFKRKNSLTRLLFLTKQVKISCYNIKKERNTVYNAAKDQYEIEWNTKYIYIFETKECLNFNRYENEKIPELKR